jgi:hypothetical protein
MLAWKNHFDMIACKNHRHKMAQKDYGRMDYGYLLHYVDTVVTPTKDDW